MNKNSLFEEFNEALAEEIKHIKKRGGDAKFILRNGELINSRGGQFIYEFITDTPIELDDDTPINIRYGNEPVSGSIITVSGVKVLIGLNKDLGNKIPQIVITTSAYFLLEILQERINDIDSKKPPFNIDIAMKTFGFQDSSVSEDYNLLTNFDELKPHISEEQKDALAKSLESEITFIWGPPGTGKTTTLSYLANELLLRDKTVLLVSHTNVAIDNALECIAKMLKNKENYLTGQILRIGPPSDRELFNDFPELSLEEWVKRRSEELNQKLSQLENQLAKEKESLSEINNALELFSVIVNTEKKMEQFQSDIQKTTAAIKEQKNNIKKLKEKAINTQEKINKAKNTNAVISFITGLNPQKLESLLNELSTLLVKEDSELSRLNRKRRMQEGNMQGLQKEYAEYKERLIALNNEREEDLKEKKLLKESQKQKEMIKKIEQEIDVIKDAIQRVAYDITQKAKLIGTTITKGYLNQDIYSRNFDVVIVDEASMAPLPALFWNCGLATSNIVIIGDFRQLAPIAMADNELVKKWLKRDIFQVTEITEKVNEQKDDRRMAILTGQRRMTQEVANLVNKLIYNNILITKQKPSSNKEKEKQTINSKPFSKEKIVLCDTSEFNPWCSRSPYKSPFNIYTAFLSVYLAEQALLDGVDDIAIITPYRAQNNLIHKLVAEKISTNDDFEKVKPSSIHRFQGREAELVILDLVEGPMRRIRWLGGGVGSEAMRLMNVAVTRARAKLIFIANLQYLKAKLKNDSILKQILKDVEKDYPTINTREFFPFIKIPVKKIESVKLNDAVPHFCNQAYFYKVFWEDLSRAKDEVVIASPFITSNRTTTFEPIFRKLYRKKIKTFIITKPFREQKVSRDFGKEIVGNLKKLGVEVITKPLSHEKLAIIDGRIIWHGSLNILSHRNTSELMIRFTTREKRFSEEALKLCGINIQKMIEEKVIDKRIKELNKKGVGFCPKGHPLVIRRGSHGIFLSCSKFPRCREAMNPTLDIIREVFGEEYLSCEKCGSSMEIKFNPRRKSRFLGCSKYPDCRFTRPL